MIGISILPEPDIIFVFGSNLAGIHRSGAAWTAKRNYQAVEGHGRGRTGNAYAIPIHDMWLHLLPLSDIELSVKTFYWYALEHPELTFKISLVGCELGYRVEEIAPMFAECPGNCVLPKEFVDVLMSNAKKV